MKVWKDILSGDEMVSDSYPHTYTFEDACLEVRSKLVTKNSNENFGIADNDEDGGGNQDPNAITVIDIVDAHRLKEIELDKKTWVAYVKGYVKKVKEKLEADGKTERVPTF